MTSHVYIGIGKQGELELVMSHERLRPVGPRLRRGNDFPAAVYKLYNESLLSAETARESIAAMEAFLRGEEVVGETPEFGSSIKKKRK